MLFQRVQGNVPLVSAEVVLRRQSDQLSEVAQVDGSGAACVLSGESHQFGAASDIASLFAVVSSFSSSFSSIAASGASAACCVVVNCCCFSLLLLFLLLLLLLAFSRGLRRRGVFGLCFLLRSRLLGGRLPFFLGFGGPAAEIINANTKMIIMAYKMNISFKTLLFPSYILL